MSKKHINSAKVNSHAFTCGCNHVSTISTIDNTNSLTKGSFPFKDVGTQRTTNKRLRLGVSRRGSLTEKYKMWRRKTKLEQKDDTNKNYFISISRYQFLFFFFCGLCIVPVPRKNGFDIVSGQSVGPVATKKSLRTHEYRVKHTSIYCFLFCFFDSGGGSRIVL